VAAMDDVLEVNVEVELTDWEVDGSAVEVMEVVGMEEVCVVEASVVLVSGGVGEEVVVVEVDSLI
ncbi:hypothetical protein KI387_036027, partial [Taxus chinensis]